MIHSRREFGKIAVASGGAAGLSMAAAKPNSNFAGVQVGVITYSFRALPVEDTLKYCIDCGASAVELMSNVAETYAGAPLPDMRALFGRGPGGPGGPPAGAGPGRGPGGPGGPGGPPPAGAGPGRRPQLTPEQQAAIKKANEDLKAWRLAAPMQKYKEFRKIWNDAGVKIYAFKLPPTMAMSNEEYDYIWNVGEILGADHLTMELPTDDALLQRVGEYAAKRKLRIAFHTHGQGGSAGFDKALGASKYTALNFDVGHYFGVNGESPVPLVEKYHDRIASLHIKDRKSPADGGANMPFGQGGTPIKEILQLMKQKGYKFPATVEYEYNTPEGSDVVTEVRKCVDFCKAAITAS